MMKTVIVAAALWSTAALAQVQVQVNVNFPLPKVTFTAPPPLVVVEPGIQVVPDYDDEVYYVNEWYWVRNEGRWFRMKGHGGKWVFVEDAMVPRVLAAVPVGKYKKFKGGKPFVPPGHEKKEHGKDKGKGKGKFREND